MRADAGWPVRLRFAKRGRIRFISHRDVARAFERAFRVERLPLAFTEGFSPHPKVSFGLALSVGHESEAEYLDVECTGDPGLDDLPARLTGALPEGMPVTGVALLAARAPSLQEAVTSLEYDIDVEGTGGGGLGAVTARPTVDEVGAALSAALASTTLEVARTRKGREAVEDVRPALLGGRVAGSTGGPRLHLEVATHPRGVRPGELVAAIGGGRLAEGRVRRTNQWIEHDGTRVEPLEAHARDPRLAPAPAAACAS